MRGTGLLLRLSILGAVVAFVYTAIRTESNASLDWRRSFECRIQECPELSDAELRVRVIKSYLHMRLDGNVTRRYAGGADQLVLLPRAVDPLRLIEEVENGTLLASLRDSSPPISSHAEIDAMSADAFEGHGSIAIYSLHHREFEIVPLGSFQRAGTGEISRFQSRYQRERPIFDEHEKARGYGRRFYWVQEFDRISLACCDGLGPKAGLSEAWYRSNSSVNIAKSRPRLLAVADGGGILERRDAN